MIKGKITLQTGVELPFELYPEYAPKTVENFVKLIKEGYYNGKTFHRVIKNFVSQGGCPYGTGTGGLGYTIKCETLNNPLTHIPGALSMAHAGKDTGCCQFFIVHTPQPHLDGVHTVFGQVTDNLPAVLNMVNGDVMSKVEVFD
ncbi:peptidylprolyl isomerase [Erysipelotrichaceae bacterium OH741_COT-311]|nr:peptidylprolyl isomerase [Erysipelotrichaceae bacterium]RRC92664.1 peptidylprolyl isomerase [Erysipelotrichaceae bacterium OH741_COT-311]